jgi:hypothetical protein
MLQGFAANRYIEPVHGFALMSIKAWATAAGTPLRAKVWSPSYADCERTMAGRLYLLLDLCLCFLVPLLPQPGSREQVWELIAEVPRFVPTLVGWCKGKENH